MLVAGLLRLPDEALTDPERFSCKSRALTDVSNKHEQSRSDRHLSLSRSSESDNLVVSSVNLPHKTHQVQWHLYRRESSDRGDQPYPAPSGTVAQQSENFQRFYRAVVSPTHVRVTAGGRIVPNNRNTAPPAFEWNKAKFAFEPPQGTCSLSTCFPYHFFARRWRGEKASQHARYHLTSLS